MIIMCHTASLCMDRLSCTYIGDGTNIVVTRTHTTIHCILDNMQYLSYMQTLLDCFIKLCLLKSLRGLVGFACAVFHEALDTLINFWLAAGLCVFVCTSLTTTATVAVFFSRAAWLQTPCKVS